MRADALEAEKIKEDLSRLRQEIDQADIEDAEIMSANVSQSQNLNLHS